MGKIKAEKYSDIMTPEEVAEFLRCSQNKVYKMLEDAEIPGVKIAGGWRILKSNLLDMFKPATVEDNEKVATPPAYKPSTKVSLGSYVKDKISGLIYNGKLTKQELLNLTDFNYCKKIFKANFPVIKVVDDSADLSSQRKDANGYSRYYKNPIAGKYLLSSQWYDHQRAAFDSWYNHLP